MRGKDYHAANLVPTQNSESQEILEFSGIQSFE